MILIHKIKTSYKSISLKKTLKNFLIKKNFIKLKKNSNGRNNLGKITSRHKGSGNKKRYRKITFLRNKNFIGIVTSIEYDPNRTSYISSVYDFKNKRYKYILSPKDLKIGDIVKSGLNSELKIGHSLSLSKLPIGSLIHNISIKPNQKAVLIRAAGTFAKLIKKTSKNAKIKLNSGIYKFIALNCFATLGTVSNELFFLSKKGKAGNSRWLNIRPKVRGVAMNPIDHPHGGGEGKTSGKKAYTPWGKPTKGGKTASLKYNFFKNESF